MSIIGRQNIYGLFEKQLISPVSEQYEYELLWKAGSASSLMVVQNGSVLEPGIDYALGLNGKRIIFTSDPSGRRTYIVYLGRELSVPRTVGIEPVYQLLVGDGSTKDFVLTAGPVSIDSVIVTQNGTVLEPNHDFSIAGNIISFVSAPLSIDTVQIYVHGVERFDMFQIEDGSIDNSKLAEQCVTNNKLAIHSVSNDRLDMQYDPWPVGENFADGLETFNGMEIQSQTVYVSKYAKVGNIIKVKLDFSCVFQGTPDNIIRYRVPYGNIEDEIVPAYITIQTAALTENGVQTWGGLQQCDIQRPGGVNYTLGTEWRFQVRFEYDITPMI